MRVCTFAQRLPIKIAAVSCNIFKIICAMNFRITELAQNWVSWASS